MLCKVLKRNCVCVVINVKKLFGDDVLQMFGLGLSHSTGYKPVCYCI